MPFVGPEAQERARGQAFKARLGANESVFGPSPKAVAAMQAAASGAWMYGDPESHDLRQALARDLDVDPSHIMVGEGIDGLLGLVVRLFVGSFTSPRGWSAGGVARVGQSWSVVSRCLPPF